MLVQTLWHLTLNKISVYFSAPRIFPILYKLARPLISDDMRNKIHVLGGSYCVIQYDLLYKYPFHLQLIKQNNYKETYSVSNNLL